MHRRRPYGIGTEGQGLNSLRSSRAVLSVSSQMWNDELAFNASEVVRSMRKAKAVAEEDSSFRLLPIFPLHDEVVFPDGRVTLRLYQERYLRLFSTLLYGEEEIDQNDCDEESPFLSSQRFGIIWRLPSPLEGVPGHLANYGVVMKVTSHEWIGEGDLRQLIVNARAYRRFSVDEVIREVPVIEASVTPTEEVKLSPDRMKAERQTVKKLIKLCDMVRKLSAAKAMRRAYFKEEERLKVLDKLTLNKAEMMKLTGEEISYWVATHMFDDLVEQQEMLQQATPRRLRYQRQLLEATKDALLEEANDNEDWSSDSSADDSSISISDEED